LDQEQIKTLLNHVQNKNISVEEAFQKIKDLPYQELEFAKVDHHRHLRKGFPEVIYCPGKETHQVVKIAKSLAETGSSVLATRAGVEVYQEVKKEVQSAEYHQSARAIVIKGAYYSEPTGKVAVLSAGTADMPVAEEAALTAEMLGARVERIYDVGVAGIHRLLDQRQKFDTARAVVVVAGMEGALPSVVGGLADAPVIAVPTSVGYGANLGGLAPLLTMLNSCASGVSVVNIDNGFGAGYSAALINRAGGSCSLGKSG